MYVCMYVHIKVISGFQRREYIALVEALFTSADDDNDGTLDNREFKTKKGQALLSVLQ